ncbi:MAG: HAD-IC family P-type ATPase [Gemmataceae bacterium]
MTPPAGHASAADRGLTAAEVAQRVAAGQVNRPPHAGFAAYRDIAVRNVATLFNALVVPAAIALFLLQDYRAAWAVSALAIANSLIGLVQEVRAKIHLDRLAILTETKARVRRDSETRMIPAGDVVRDDCILLAAGESVVADGTVRSASFLEIDEALLTGESDPVPRHAGERLLSGSFCVAGEGVYRADQVGGEAFAHRTSAEARRYQFAPSPMQRLLDTLIRILSAIAVALCLLYVGLYFLRGFPQADLWRMIAATVTSMVPQGLVLMTTLAFTLGALRMVAKGAVVQRLNAVESMASVDVLCLDKTGTLTTSRLTLDQVRAVSGSEATVRGRLQLFAWASLDGGSKSLQALQAGLGPLPAGVKPELLDQLPFKSQNRYSAVRVRVGTDEQSLALGAFEAMQPFLVEGESADAAWRELLPTGLRLLLFAEIQNGNTPLAGSLAGRQLRPLALVALRDELRREAGAILEALSAQGIRLKILSGDNPETVRATVGNLNLPLTRDPVVTGDELAAAADPVRLLNTSSVFGRVAPRQKLQIVSWLQGEGRHVAMTGDGINDILPIKQADLGIAMGQGCPATKAVAGLVLENNDFGLLPATLDEGRRILHNLRRAAKLFLLKNVYTLFLIIVVFGILGLEFPYLPQQVTLLNLLTIGGPAFLIMLGQVPVGTAVRAGFLREVGFFALVSGLVMGIAGAAVWLLSAWVYHDELIMQRTLLLSTLVLLGLGNVVLLADRDRRLHWWVAAALPAYLVAMYLPPTAHFFELTPLTVGRWLLPTVFAATGPAFVRVSSALRVLGSAPE